MKLLLAEDTQDLNRALCAVLQHEGYDVTPCLDGGEALSHILEDSFDVVVLDIMMPVMDGLEVLTQMRSRHILTPVLMLTARSEVDDRVMGLDAGADDYLTKPFAMKELTARLRSLTRRTLEYTSEEISLGRLRLDSKTFELSCENSIRLSVKEYELMETLMRSAGKRLESAWLLEHIWAGEPEANESTLWFYISYLKRKLQAVGSDAVIEGVQRSWYRLLEEGAASEVPYE